MAGEKAFNDVLSFVGKSKLNFSILQTPFSAQLSLKKSFAKKFHGYSEREFEGQDESEDWKDTTKKLENRLTTVNLENLRLKKTIEENDHLIQNLENKCKTLDDNLKIEKKKNKKERQKTDKRLAEESESKIKVETIKSEKNSVDVDVPTFNKFAILDDDNTQ